MAAGIVSTASAMMAHRHPIFMVEASPLVFCVTGPAQSTEMSAKWLEADMTQGPTQACGRVLGPSEAAKLSYLPNLGHQGSKNGPPKVLDRPRFGGFLPPPLDFLPALLDPAE